MPGATDPARGQSRVYREQGSTGIVVASGGRILVEEGGSIVVSATLAIGANGVVDGSTGTGRFIFAAGEIASADIATAAIDSSHIAADAVASAELTSRAITGEHLQGNLASGTLALGAHLMAARELASGETLVTASNGLITPETTPALALISTADQTWYLNYASAVVDGLKLPPIAMPADLSTVDAVTLELYGETAGTATAADAEQGFDIRVWAGIGDTEMGATHPNFTSTPAWQGITVASGDLSTAMLNVTLVPSAHAGRAIRLYDMRMRYTRST